MPIQLLPFSCPQRIYESSFAKQECHARFTSYSLALETFCGLTKVCPQCNTIQICTLAYLTLSKRRSSELQRPLSDQSIEATYFLLSHASSLDEALGKLLPIALLKSIQYKSEKLSVLASRKARYKQVYKRIIDTTCNMPYF